MSRAPSTPHRVTTIIVGLLLVLLGLARPAQAGPQAAIRTIVVLEYRAGVRRVSGLADRMAQRLAKLTAHRVISPADAQRRLGARAADDVATCRGEPRCVARIGARLAADEVLLVGISQLGDTILAIQRIEVRGAGVAARLADSLGRKQGVSEALVDRYLRRLLPAAEFKRYGRILIRTSAVGDEVFLDERLRGVSPLAPLVVPAPGRYTLRIRRAGHVDFVARLDVLPESSVEVTPTLSPRGRRAPRWFERWWVWALVGGAVAGATTAAVLSATRSPNDVSALVRWPRR